MIGGRSPARRVWIDTDPAVGEPGCDVDDGYAILQAINSPELTIAGISTVFGNAALDVTHEIARQLLTVVRAEHVALHRGAAGPGKLAVPTAASDALSAELDNAPLTILALGPLTNVATALTTHPELAPRIEQLVIVAGRRPGQRFMIGQRGPLPDFNLESDPQACQTILAAVEVPLVLAGFEVATHVRLEPADLERLAQGPPAARWLAERSGDWLRRWSERLDLNGFHPFDTLAVGVVLTPQLIECETVEVALVTTAGHDEPNWRGAPPPTPAELHAAQRLPDGRPALYAATARPRFRDDLMRRLLRP